MTNSLTGKVAIVSGANSGIGLSIAKKLVAEGAQVVLTGRRKEAGVTALAEVDGGDNAIYVIQDVAIEADWKHVVEETITKFGKLDILVNNAGIGGPNGYIDQISLADWRQLMSINLDGNFLGAKYAFTQFKKQGTGGAIVNVSSVGGLKPIPGAAAYSSSKGGTLMLTKELALEGASFGIRVNSVHPGWINTPIVPDAIRATEKQQQPSGHFGEPDDIANITSFLVSDDAKNITGAQFVSDGGNLLI
ncbi:SDR family oxidoreductase [Periweissella cryptocerci]|uniref:SDR family oxidoreductase n=1 Tax=Periweissella cryptocerci TaxID=2506420 RepID=A0A4P6YQR3_9LACO|nr:SDR family oxidoreductase [Periweissella cryptocerci]QBO34938.1 SDR family oxidoreductase [Periweissella cryptocerci]